MRRILTGFCALILLCSALTAFGQARRKKPAPKIDFSDLLEEAPPEWVEVGRSGSGVVEISPARVSRDGSRVLAWFKSSFDDVDQKRRMVESFGMTGEANFDDVSHAMAFWHIECSERKMALLTDSLYDVRGRVLGTKRYKGDEWDYVVPESVGESMLKTACKIKARR